jgi:multicomponent Na+:H+ antiporter subunit C
MSELLALVTGGLFAAGVYMLLRRSLFKLVIGLLLISHGTNVLIFTAGGVTRAEPPIIPTNSPGIFVSTDPLPQAFILTALVINFGVLAFTLVLFHRGDNAFGTDDPDDLKGNEP